jgi:putative spermidine/putrescine transport system substrate-binding protein
MADLFDVENFPGRRALQDRPAPTWNGRSMPTAWPRRHLRRAGTPEGVDRAFAKLDTIKDHLIFWTEGAQAPQLLADKEVSFATGYNGRMFEAAEVEGQPFQIIWDGQIVEWDGWVVPADGNNLDAVMEYLYWATDTQRLADQAKFISYGPARASSAELVDAPCRSRHRHEPAHADPSRQLLQTPIVLDNDFWTDYGDELRERFANWMLQ